MSTALATLDYVSGGRAGWRAQLSPQPAQARHFGRRELPDIASLFAEAADYVEVVRRLWDSWEDDAVIRDVPTGRFVDRDKLHYIDFEGEWFSVRGPSITPRPPQGQLPIVALAHAKVPYEFAARAADIVFITPASTEHAAQLVTEIKVVATNTKRHPSSPPLPYADLTVFLDTGESAARDRKDRLDRASGTAYRSDTAIFTGTPDQLASLLLDWRAAGLAGFRLRPGTIPHDLRQVTRALVPALQARGAFRTEYEAGFLRDRLGLGPRPANRYGKKAAV
jgi:alkanesulfonate monooxygenase SsuD/methylene tetrahydromethanopterin reductase-like flavin-dependent oxidoreductase (luciferase family)